MINAGNEGIGGAARHDEWKMGVSSFTCARLDVLNERNAI